MTDVSQTQPMQDYVQKKDRQKHPSSLTSADLTSNLDDGRSSSNGIVCHCGVAASQDHVALAADGSTAFGRGRNGYGKATIDGGSHGKDRSGHGDEGSVNWGLAILSLEIVLRSEKGDG